MARTEKKSKLSQLKDELEQLKKAYEEEVRLRKKMESSLKEQSELYDNIIKTSPDTVIITDLSGNLLFTSENARTMFGVEDPAQVYGPSVLNYIDPAHHDRVRQAFQFRLAGKITGPREYMAVKADGTPFSIEVNGKIIHDQEGIARKMLYIVRDISERERAKEALVKSEERFRLATEQSRTMVWEIDDKGVFKYISPVVKDVCGYEPEELVGKKRFFDLHPEQTREKFIQATVERFTSERGFQNLESPILSKNGEIVWISTSGIPMVDSQGKLIGYMGANIDITKRKLAQESLERSENALNYAQEIVQMGSWEMDKLTQKITWSRNFCKMLGIPYGTIIRKESFNEKVHPDDLPVVCSNLERLKQGAASVSYDIRLKMPDNTWHWIHSNIVARHKDGRLLSLSGVNIDITDKKIRDDQLKKLSLAVEQSPVSIIITDQQAVVEYANFTLLSASGYAYDEVVGKSISLFSTKENSVSKYKMIREVMSSGKAWQGELLSKKKNGGSSWEHISINPVKNEKGEVTNYLIISKDISRIKMDEQKIHELNAHLEEEIRETREARQRAEESDRLKSAFLANMSHEIRTPLNAILGFTQILNAEDDISPKERKDYISIINQNSESLQQIISDVLDISKLETHQLVIKDKPFDVMQVLNELHTLFKQKLGSMGKEKVQLKVQKKAGPLWLNTDKIRLIQIFSNLLSNSAKFTNEGMIRFGISRVSDEWIELFVSDTGIGIKPEYRDTIFERFRQVDNSLTRVYGGVGLGLAIVKNLIGLMKGEITVKSVIGQGTTFTFSLPVVIHPQTKIGETGVLNGNAAGS